MAATHHNKTHDQAPAEVEHTTECDGCDTTQCTDCDQRAGPDLPCTDCTTDRCCAVYPLCGGPYPEGWWWGAYWPAGAARKASASTRMGAI